MMIGNCSNAGSDFTYKATTDAVSISFTLDKEPTGEQVMVNPALSGIIQPAGEGIRDIVDRDYFGTSFDGEAMIAGPFADLKEGKNTYNVWPREEITAPPSTQVEDVNLALGKKVTASSETGTNTCLLYTSIRFTPTQNRGYPIRLIL